MRIVFLGPPGAGKGTQAAALAQRLSLAHLSTGDMLREATRAQTSLGKEAAEHMNAGRLVPSELVQKLIAERISQPDCRKGYLLDGFPRTVDQAEELDKWLSAQGTKIDAVINLAVDDAVLLARLASRGRQDDAEDVVRERLRQYDKLTRPLVDYYRRQGVLREVNGHGTPEQVLGRIVVEVDRAG